MVSLHGQGDAEIAFVDKVTFDWINSPRPVGLFKNHYMQDNVPSEVMARIMKQRELDDNDTVGFTVTIGSCENDRAMEAVELPIIVDGLDCRFDSVGEAINFASEHGLRIASSFDGCIY